MCARPYVIDTVPLPAAGSWLRLHEHEVYTPGEDAVVLPLGGRRGRMTVQAELLPLEGDAVQGELLVDTGLRGALLLHTPFVERHDLVSRSGHTIHRTVGGGVGGRAAYEVGRLRSLRIGPLEVEELPVWLAQTRRGLVGTDRWAGVLGSRFLQRYRVTFDYGDGRLILAPAVHDPDLLGPDKSGTFLVADNDDRAVHRVLDVVPGSPADEAGLRAGDVVRAIDGRAGRSLEETRRLLRGPEGTEVRVSVERDGEVLEKRLVLRRLV